MSRKDTHRVRSHASQRDWKYTNKTWRNWRRRVLHKLTSRGGVTVEEAKANAASKLTGKRYR